MSIFEIAFSGFSLFYAACMLFFYAGILREERRERNTSVNPLPRVSVIVSARNEETRIMPLLNSLIVQDYPADRFEVLIVDDRSTDDTFELVSEFIRSRHLKNFRCLKHQPESTDEPTYKKHAILFGINTSSGEIVLTTDADCRVPSTWVRSMESRYDTKTGLVAGLVAYDAENDTVFKRMQALEFAGLVFTGVGAIGNNTPLICNASNLSYRRIAFESVGGFAGHEHIPSGDDDLLMQNIDQKTNWEIRYNLDSAGTVSTNPVNSVAEFLNQRARWASKSRDYPGSQTFFVLLAIYLFYVALFLAIPLALFGIISWWMPILALGLKLGSEFLIVRHAAIALGQRESLPLFPLAQSAQILYILIAGFAGFFKLYRWRSIS
ncbi:MAG: glycosyltransferase [Calditrichia bacterium]